MISQTNQQPLEAVINKVLKHQTCIAVLGKERSGGNMAGRLEYV